MQNNYVIDVTNQVDNKFSKSLNLIAQDLESIVNLESRIRQIVLRGGAVVDLLLGLEPNDYDLFYSYEENGKTIEECRCSDVQKAVDKTKFSYFDKQKVELENSYEKEPKAEPIERTCDLISFHTSSVNMFCVDQKGHVWTNKETWSQFQNNICEIRYEGMLPWAYFPRPNDSHDYFAFMCYEIIRSLSYLSKRNFNAGPKLTILLEHAPYFVEHGILRKGQEGFKKYSKGKGVTKEAIETVISKLMLNDLSKNNVTKALIRLC